VQTKKRREETDDPILHVRAGAPGGDKDEACANAGLDKIKDRLN
jgi:hypothetical protein